MINHFKKIFSILTIVFLTGCAGNAYITSDPPGAKIYVNDGYKGDTPVRVSTPDAFGSGSIYVFKAEKEGYETETLVFKEQGLQDANAAIPGQIHFTLKALSTSLISNIKNSTISKTPTPQLPSRNKNIGNYFSSNWAVVIGISQYQYAGQNGLSNLIFADDDAKAFAQSLRNLGWSESHIKLLTNEEATQRNIMIALESWLSKAGRNDQIVLFWAGHGFPDPEDPEKVYFATYDTDINIPVTGYRMDQVRRALEERKAKNVILLADTCHAGKLITRGDGNRGISIVPNIKQKNTPKGWVFMVGADTDRQAIENASWSNGAFTHSLVNGLNGAADGFQSIGPKDGVVTMGELRAYMNTAMPEETQKVLGVAKRPVIATSSGDPDIWNLTLQVK